MGKQYVTDKDDIYDDFNGVLEQRKPGRRGTIKDNTPFMLRVIQRLIDNAIKQDKCNKNKRNMTMTMKEPINAVESRCNECNNRICYTDTAPCKGFVSHARTGFSFLEKAADNSMDAVAELLNIAKIQFLPNNPERGFNLMKS